MRRRPLPQQLTEAAVLEFAWKAHTANVDWVKNVDQKASIVLVFATALTAVVIQQSINDTGALAHATGVKLAATVVTGTFFGLAALLALAAVRPDLRARKARKEASTRLIYFGHLRHRTAGDIDRALAGLTVGQARKDLAGQLAEHGKIAWRKHRLLQWSLSCLVAGALPLVLALFVL